MTSRRIVTVALLAFAIGSIVYMAMRDTVLSRRQETRSGREETYWSSSNDPSVVVYFFDSDKECTTCENLERYAYEALQTHFAPQLTSGQIEWRVRNVFEPENEHFVTEFGIYTKSVVVVRIENGQPVKWKNLESIWDLVYDERAYVEYIRAQVQEFLGDTD